MVRGYPPPAPAPSRRRRGGPRPDTPRAPPGAPGRRPRMSGPHPHDLPSDHPHDTDHDEAQQPQPAEPGVAASGFPEPPGEDPGDLSRRPSPYSALNHPVRDPDPTAWPDPYDDREDPRAPADEMVFPGDGRSHTPVGATSDSEPPAADDIQAVNTNAPDGDDLDR